MKTDTLIYWITTVIFVVLLIADGIAGIMHEKNGVAVMLHLGYPLYVLTIVGIAKLFAAVAILQTQNRTVKEWAFAGFAIACYGAFMSRFFIGDTGIDLLFPIIFLGIMLVPYFAWKKLER